MNGLTPAQRALLGRAGRDGELTAIVGRPAAWWRTLEALIDKGLIRQAGSRTEAHGQITRRVYRLTDAGQRRLTR